MHDLAAQAENPLARVHALWTLEGMGKLSPDVLIAALKASGIPRLADAPAFQMNIATGDSLLHGPRPGGERQAFLDPTADPLRHVYETEDSAELRRILGAKYHVVVVPLAH